MLLKSFQSQNISNACRILLVALLCFYVWPAYSATTPAIPPLDTLAGQNLLSAQSMLVQFAKTVPNLMRLVTAIAYVLGMVFVIRGILKLKHLGESRTMMSQEHHLATPISYIVIGTMLLYLPSAVNTGLNTFWTEPNPYGYTQLTDQWGEFLRICFLVVQLIGTIAFIRGLVILSNISGHGQQGGFSRGLTHIIGGILCINIYQFVQVILATFGLPTLS